MVAGRTAEEALSRLGPDERRWIADFREQVRALVGSRMKDLRLFGSRARGEKHEESDIDLLVLVQDLDEETWRRIADLAYSISPWLSPLIEDFDGYHSPSSRASGIYQEIRAESVRL